jgi:hypothetical protein
MRSGSRVKFLDKLLLSDGSYHFGLLSGFKYTVECMAAADIGCSELENIHYDSIDAPR